MWYTRTHRKQSRVCHTRVWVDKGRNAIVAEVAAKHIYGRFTRRIVNSAEGTTRDVRRRVVGNLQCSITTDATFGDRAARHIERAAEHPQVIDSPVSKVYARAVARYDHIRYSTTNIQRGVRAHEQTVGVIASEDTRRTGMLILILRSSATFKKSA